MTGEALGAAIRQSWPYALISGGTVLTAFLALPAQSLPNKYLDGDVNLLVPYAGCSVLVASLGVLIVLQFWSGRGGSRPPWRHLAVPPVLALLIPSVLALCGGARSRWGTGLLCAGAAAGAHLALGLPRRRFRVLLCGLLTAGAAVTAVSCQPLWRAEDFRATGLPFVVADVPGYRLTGTYADVGVIFLEYRDVDGQGMVLDASIGRRSCPANPEPDSRCFDVSGGHHLSVGPPYAIGNFGIRAPIPGGITIRPVSAVYLGSYPVGWTSLPD
jgi:hypothetical protein